MGFDHKLYRYGAGVSMPLSDMNGRGEVLEIRACGLNALLDGRRDPAAGAGLRPVAARDRDPASCRA
jgi:hypothetical protein